MTDYLASASAGVPSRSDEIKAFAEDLKKLIAAGEHHISGLKVVAIVDGKLVSGDVEEAVRGYYHFLAGMPVDKFNMADDVNVFVELCVERFGDSDPVRKAATSIYQKKGA